MKKRIEDRPVRILQFGIGGMGYHYLKTLLFDFPPGQVEIVGVVDPYPEKSALYDEVKRRDIPICPSFEKTVDSGLTADLAVISSPLQFHVVQSLEALKAGCHVLCEKPLAATIQEADRLIGDEMLDSHWMRIGYQWSYTTAIQELKKDIKRGRFGKPIRAKSMFLWPRDAAYYSRNNWAGRIRDSDNRWVLDSPANSAMAHDLHNLLFLLGEDFDRSALPVNVSAELYRAYPIENYDTVASRIKTSGEVEILFYASHTTPDTIGPFFSLEFEDASVVYGEDSKTIVATNRDGEIHTYGSPETENPFNKLFEAVEAVYDSIPVVCGPEAARSQTLCVNAIQDTIKDIGIFPQFMIKKKENRIWVDELQESLLICYRKNTLPFEEGFSWARRGGTINVEGYSYFPGGLSPLKNKGQNL